MARLPPGPKSCNFFRWSVRLTRCGHSQKLIWRDLHCLPASAAASPSTRTLWMRSRSVHLVRGLSWLVVADYLQRYRDHLVYDVESFLAPEKNHQPTFDWGSVLSEPNRSSTTPNFDFNIHMRNALWVGGLPPSVTKSELMRVFINQRRVVSNVDIRIRTAAPSTSMSSCFMLYLQVTSLTALQMRLAMRSSTSLMTRVPLTRLCARTASCASTPVSVFAFSGHSRTSSVTSDVATLLDPRTITTVLLVRTSATKAASSLETPTLDVALKLSRSPPVPPAATLVRLVRCHLLTVPLLMVPAISIWQMLWASMRLSRLLSMARFMEYIPAPWLNLRPTMDMLLTAQPLRRPLRATRLSTAPTLCAHVLLRGCKVQLYTLSAVI